MLSDIGVIGLGVMGSNLALNMARHGYRVSVYNRTASVTEDFVKGLGGSEKGIAPFDNLEEFCASLAIPRKVILMVKAGDPVDATIRALTAYLAKGDLIIDGGNSRHTDTERRYRTLSREGLLYIGTGISGGEEGALKGPSIMPGGSPEGWKLCGDILIDISAKSPDGMPCCAFMGPGGAGHFVKTVHNGIEYADMQLIAETYHFMREVLGMPAEEAAGCFSEWDKGPLESYLIDITADVLRFTDSKTGRPLVEMIKDEAGQKGTGRWTAEEALALGVPASSLAEAVFARNISARTSDRRMARERIARPERKAIGGAERDELIALLPKALLVAKISAYAQGFSLMAEASKAYDWGLDLGKVALIWRGGCIIRARFLDDIAKAYEGGEPGNLLFCDKFMAVVNEDQYALRRLVAEAVMGGIPVSALSTSLGYIDGLRAEKLPANLIQAQRDYFGAHTYERVDEEGTFHTDWLSRNSD